MYVVLPDTVFAVVGGDGAAQAIGVLLAVLQHIVTRVSAEVMGLAASKNEPFLHQSHLHTLSETKFCEILTYTQ